MESSRARGLGVVKAFQRLSPSTSFRTPFRLPPPPARPRLARGAGRALLCCPRRRLSPFAGYVALCFPPRRELIISLCVADFVASFSPTFASALPSLPSQVYALTVVSHSITSPLSTCTSQDIITNDKFWALMCRQPPQAHLLRPVSFSPPAQGPSKPLSLPRPLHLASPSP